MCHGIGVFKRPSYAGTIVSGDFFRIHMADIFAWDGRGPDESPLFVVVCGDTSVKRSAVDHVLLQIKMTTKEKASLKIETFIFFFPPYAVRQRAFRGETPAIGVGVNGKRPFVECFIFTFRLRACVYCTAVTISHAWLHLLEASTMRARSRQQRVC